MGSVPSSNIFKETKFYGEISDEHPVTESQERHADS